MLIEQRSPALKHICQCFAGSLGELIASLPFGTLGLLLRYSVGSLNGEW